MVNWGKQNETKISAFSERLAIQQIFVTLLSETNPDQQNEEEPRVGFWQTNISASPNLQRVSEIKKKKMIKQIHLERPEFCWLWLILPMPWFCN